MDHIDLKMISTRELKRAYQEGKRGCVFEGLETKTDGGFEKRGRIANRLVKGGESRSVVASISELKAELESRPHIPGKKEGKLLRRLMKDTGQSAEWLRAHPKFGEQLADAQHPNRQRITPVWAPYYAARDGKNFGNHFKVIK